LAAGAEPGDALLPASLPPLVQACRAGHVEVVRLLISVGVALDARDRDGRSLVEVARGAGQDDVVALLEGRVAAADPVPALRARWLQRLDVSHPEWPEWEALRRIATGPLDARWSGPAWLVGGDPEVSVCVGDEVPMAPGLPAWAVALHGLRPGAQLDNAGQLLGVVAWGRATSASTDILGEHVAGLPPRAWALQMNESGTCTVLTPDGLVWAYDLDTARFQPIGPIEPFLRYCLWATLQGLHWCSDAYSRGLELERFGLRRLSLVE
jgi:hypothetical protein